VTASCHGPLPQERKNIIILCGGRKQGKKQQPNWAVSRSKQKTTFRKRGIIQYCGLSRPQQQKINRCDLSSARRRKNNNQPVSWVRVEQTKTTIKKKMQSYCAAG